MKSTPLQQDHCPYCSDDLLQVLISIQSMILGTAHPYFNEPGFSSSEGTKQ